MYLISHRGNLNGIDPELENSPDYINEALDLGFDCEIDLWLNEKGFFLGHDGPQYPIDMDWLQDRKEHLWIHGKNIQVIDYLSRTYGSSLNYFWHQTDDITLTSKLFLWTYPGKPLFENSIAVMSGQEVIETSCIAGVCSDYIKHYE